MLNDSILRLVNRGTHVRVEGSASSHFAPQANAQVQELQAQLVAALRPPVPPTPAVAPQPAAAQLPRTSAPMMPSA